MSAAMQHQATANRDARHTLPRNRHPALRARTSGGRPCRPPYNIKRRQITLRDIRCGHTTRHTTHDKEPRGKHESKPKTSTKIIGKLIKTPKSTERGLHAPIALPFPFFPPIGPLLSINKNGTIHAELKLLQ